MRTSPADQSPVVVYSANEPVRVEILRSLLQDAGIECQVANGNQGAFAGVDVVPVELIVRSEDARRARDLIAAHDQLNDA